MYFKILFKSMSVTKTYKKYCLSIAQYSHSLDFKQKNIKSLVIELIATRSD